VAADGTISNLKLFAERGGEAVTSDSDGDVYIAAGQIYVYSKGGELLSTVRVPERPLSLVFGGADRKTLFIAARTSLYAVRLRLGGGLVTRSDGTRETDRRFNAQRFVPRGDLRF
jgi:hypothetical protein